ncbi:MAG TPA: hypothetical protein VHJ34_05280 [Actinomycetota bacterium]|nr:hypothetical protein [Actinomycetota bacterium]
MTAGGEPVGGAADLSDADAAILGCYDDLKAVLERHGDDLPPFAQRNALKALAALWQVANGFDRDPGQIYDLGA